MSQYEALRNVADPRSHDSLGIYLADGKGGGRRLTIAEIPDRPAPGEFLWFHLDRTDPDHRRWIENEAGLDPVTARIVLEEDTRPRLVANGNQMIVILRGVNLDPGEDDDDAMVSLRILCLPDRVISLRRVRLFSIVELRDALLEGRGPNRTGRFLIEAAQRLVEKQAGVIGDLVDEVDAIEEAILEAEKSELRGRLSAMRRRSIELRRYVAPQREVLGRLIQERSELLDEMDRVHAREVYENQTRLVEELDSARDRAALAQEELTGHVAEQMNRNMYLLSIIAGIFLPLGLLTGLLGINVGGIPGSHNDHAFLIVCFILLLMAAFAVLIFRRLRIL